LHVLALALALLLVLALDPPLPLVAVEPEAPPPLVLELPELLLPHAATPVARHKAANETTLMRFKFLSSSDDRKL
jgi:hypothetical protein